MLPRFHDLPEELQGSCARFLDTPSAGSFGKANKACCWLVERQAGSLLKGESREGRGGCRTGRLP